MDEIKEIISTLEFPSELKVTYKDDNTPAEKPVYFQRAGGKNKVNLYLEALSILPPSFMD